MEPITGRDAIRDMFAREFAAAEMVCIVENIFEDGDWAILEWRDPLGLRGCGFFHVTDGKIAFQRGYWDRLTFLKAHNLPLENPPLDGALDLSLPLEGEGILVRLRGGKSARGAKSGPRRCRQGARRWR